MYYQKEVLVGIEAMACALV